MIQSNGCLRWFLLSQIVFAVQFAQPALAQVPLPPNFISPNVPHDVPAGTNASIQDLSIFAWQEFIALNWPSVDPAATGKRGTPNSSADFVGIKKGFDGSFPLVVWHTYRHKNELFPAGGNTDASFDSKIPVYKYYNTGLTAGGSNPSFNLFNNLDETSQIGLCTMYAQDKIRIAYEAKVNRAVFDYANNSQLTACTGTNCPNLAKALRNTKTNLPQLGGICAAPQGVNGPFVMLQCGDASIAGPAGEGTIEIKAAWRQLTAQEQASGRFFTQKVIFYTSSSSGALQYQNAIWGLVALHIIHKTQSFPTFVFASWEQVDNYNDQTNQNTQKLRFQNISGTPLPANIPVARAHPIHSQIPPVNDAVHAAFKAKDPATIWQYYKLIGVQGKPVTGPPQAGAPIDDLSYYYLANIVVETNQTLQNFFGGVDPKTATPVPFNNVYLKGAVGSPFQMGGCQGCHGTQGQSIGGDMSRLIGTAPSNSNATPESINADGAMAVKFYLKRAKDGMARSQK